MNTYTCTVCGMEFANPHKVVKPTVCWSCAQADKDESDEYREQEDSRHVDWMNSSFDRQLDNHVGA